VVGGRQARLASACFLSQQGRHGRLNPISARFLLHRPDVGDARFGEALDLVVEGQEPLARQVEAVVGPQFAVGDEDEDLFLEIEQLENGEGVTLAVDGAQVVAPGNSRSVREVRQKSYAPALRGRRVAVKLALGIGKPTLT
jgi:hypothetical protein